MKVEPRIKKLVFFVWMLIVPPGMILTYMIEPPASGLNWLHILGFLLLASIVSSMPMVINNTPIFLIQWVSIAVFLRFGLFIEMITVQVSILVLLLRIRIPKDNLFRLPLNSLMFFAVSLVSGLVYFELGGKVAASLVGEGGMIWLAILYAILYYFLNQLIISFFQYAIYKSNESFFGKDFIWESATTVITFPIGFVLYTLYEEMGLAAVLFVGFPFASLSLILHLYYSSQKINEYLQTATEIGHQLAERLNVKDVVDLFVQKLSEMLPVDYAYVIDIRNNDEFVLVRRIENGDVLPIEDIILENNKGVSGKVWSSGKSVLFSSRKEWKHLPTHFIPDNAQSILGVPIMRSNQAVGILVLASKRKRTFEKSQLMIVDILCSHFAIAIENARHYEETKEFSERCPLTKLYNYRYFDSLLCKEFEMIERFERKRVSLIILDIDHFKIVNDTYGHQSGNEVLRELAVRISRSVGQSGTVARFGGEEFVILLPEATIKEAYNLAELIRQSIANWPFNLTEHMEADKKALSIRITASFGVATAPEDADDPMSLVRHADRALYVGAKRAGRNRVGEYVK